MPCTHVERVHNKVGQANPSSDFLVKPIFVLHYAAKVCEVLVTSVCSPYAWTDWTMFQQASKYLDLGFGPGGLQSHWLHLPMHTLRAITRTSSHSISTASSAKTSVSLVMPTDGSQQLCYMPPHTPMPNITCILLSYNLNITYIHQFSLNCTLPNKNKVLTKYRLSLCLGWGCGAGKGCWSGHRTTGPPLSLVILWQKATVLSTSKKEKKR